MRSCTRKSVGISVGEAELRKLSALYYFLFTLYARNLFRRDRGQPPDHPPRRAQYHLINQTCPLLVTGSWALKTFAASMLALDIEDITMKAGDFSDLAEDYATFRPGYSPEVCRALLSLTGKKPSDIGAADVGAGTGIWTRTLYNAGCREMIAVEPNNAMRSKGMQQSEDLAIKWVQGSGEATKQESSSHDLLTMASSFHWTDFSAALAEFYRVLQPGGWFAALWNPRFIEASPLLVEIEQKLFEMVPDLKRVSSGRSEFTSSLSERLMAAPNWAMPVYLESYHIEPMSCERYIGIWRSVNDVQQQAGPKRFAQFLDYVQDRLSDVEEIEAASVTRAWAVQRT